MKARRPERVDPLVWEQLPHGVRLALMSRHARTPERREALKRAALEHGLKQLEASLSELERVSTKREG